MGYQIRIFYEKWGGKHISIYGDAYSFYKGIVQNLDMFDRVFVFEPADVSLLKKGIKAEYLPIGAADELFYKEKVGVSLEDEIRSFKL